MIELDQAVPGMIGSESAQGEEISEAAWELIAKCTNTWGSGGTAKLIGTFALHLQSGSYRIHPCYGRDTDYTQAKEADSQ